LPCSHVSTRHSADNSSLSSTAIARPKANGSKFLIGDRLSALDIYWAAFAALVQPLPPELCPMATAFRDHYAGMDAGVLAATSPLLLEHRDFIYREYLELPIVF